MLHPWMLLGLVGLSVPIIIHLIQRRRLRPQVLATMQFLEAEDVANAFAPVPRDWLQLLLRLTVLGLFVLLMARLVAGSDRPGPRTMAVLLDQSMSMQRQVNGKNVFDRQKEQIGELIDGLGPDDRLSLRLVGDRVTLETGYLQDKDQLRQMLGECRVSDSGGQALVPAVRGAVRQLAARREVNGCVLVFSDQQRVGYQNYADEAERGGDGNRTVAFRDELEQGRVKLFLIDERPPGEPNLAIEEARFRPEQVHVGASSRLTAIVRNYSDQPQTTQVQVIEGEQPGLQRPLTLEPGEAAHIDLVHRFEAPVDSACRVEIQADAQPGDDRFFLPMRIHDRKQILLVAAASEQGASERGLEVGHRGVDLLTYALNPGEALGQAGTAVAVKRVTPQLFSRVSLPFYSVIILYGVTELEERSARDLETFVKNGGGLWLIPDRDVSPLRFSEGLGRLLNGLAIGQLKQPEQAPTIDRDEASLGNPLLVPLLREEWGNPRDLYFSQYFGVQAPGTAEFVLRAANTDPLAALYRLERGRVFVQLFPGGLESSSLPRTSAFVPLVHQVVTALGQRGEKDRADVLRVGEVRRMNVPEFRGLPGEVQVAGPDKSHFALTGPDAAETRVEGLLRAGAYEVSHPARKTNRQRWLTVNPLAGESDPTPVSDDAVVAIWGTQNAQRLPFAELSGQFARKHEVFGWIALLVWLAFMAEALVGAWQSRRKSRAAATGGPSA